MRDALAFIDQHVATSGNDKPFFLYYCSQAGHSPYAPPVSFNVKDPLNTDDLAASGAIPIAGTTVNKRTDMIREGDVAIGLFIEKLKSLGLFHNTLIVFTSDNGAAIGPASSWSETLYHDAKDNQRLWWGSYRSRRPRLWKGAQKCSGCFPRWQSIAW